MVSLSFAIFLVALNFSLSLTTFLGNVLILFALRKVNSIRPQTKLLFQCLAVTDLAVGLAVQPLLAIAFIPGIIKRNIIFYLYQVSVSMGFFLLTVSVLTTTAICVDRLLALLLGLRYPQIVTFRRVRLLLFCFWLLSSVVIGLRYSTGYVETARSMLIALMLLSLLVSLAYYAKIYRRLRHQQQRVQIHVPQPQPQPRNGEAILLNIARYRKTVSSIVCVQLAQGFLLSSIYVSGHATNKRNNTSDRLGFIISWSYDNNSVLKFNSKPDSLLLEDKRGKTSGEEHDQTIKLVLNIEITAMQDF